MPAGALPRPLTAKQLRFVEEYLVDLNATAAARRAEYSEKTADVAGPRLLGNVRVQAAIQKELDRRSKRTEITADRVLEGLLREARYQGTGASHGARVTAWTQLGKHLAMFTDRHEHSGQIGPRTIEIVPLRPDESANAEDPATDSALGIPARNGSASV